MNIRFVLTFGALLWSTTVLFSQGTDTDFLRSLGKLYVVVAVILVIFLGLVYFLWRMERRIKNIENQIKENE